MGSEVTGQGLWGQGVAALPGLRGEGGVASLCGRGLEVGLQSRGHCYVGVASAAWGAWPRCVGVASGGTSKRGPLRWGRGLSVCGRGLEVRGVAPGWGYKTGPIAIGRGLRAKGRGLEVEGVASRCGGAPMRGGRKRGLSREPRNGAL